MTLHSPRFFKGSEEKSLPKCLFRHGSHWIFFLLFIGPAFSPTFSLERTNAQHELYSECHNYIFFFSICPIHWRVRFPDLMKPLRSIMHLVWVNAHMLQMDMQCVVSIAPVAPLASFLEIHAYPADGVIANAQDMTLPLKANLAKLVQRWGTVFRCLHCGCDQSTWY